MEQNVIQIINDETECWTQSSPQLVQNILYILRKLYCLINNYFNLDIYGLKLISLP